MSAARLLLVRHGESTWNAVRRWQGRADPPLSPRGEAQAAAAAANLAEIGTFDAVATSLLRRARRTGELLAAPLGLEVHAPIDELSERSAGEWEGLTRVEIEERYPGYLAAGDRPPGYEPDDEVVERATGALVGLVHGPMSVRSGTSGRRLVVVTHGGVINALERHAEEEWRRLDNLEGRWFEVDDAAHAVVPVGDRVQLLDAGDGAPAPPDDAGGSGYA